MGIAQFMSTVAPLHTIEEEYPKQSPEIIWIVAAAHYWKDQSESGIQNYTMTVCEE